ncbi:MAG: hypothetical protein Athens101428_228 [Candidatus Berkelbacteria bacterium Athens1014_28]|uniref:Uncharacterized protein n=1 Tax=Candidatus Berkelbacteria bacterium Athens1014_28 TaxID=2017145 RepID=A0A554LP10_9BACT|nr:MAG: hypothetical protein Athens101428_228 [Candidatus Berkelbacteria bacterium Athens1014_28]
MERPARVAQLVERVLAKDEVAGSNPVSRSMPLRQSYAALEIFNQINYEQKKSTKKEK